MTTDTLPNLHAPYTGGDPTLALDEYIDVINHTINNQPRSKQTRIGPSEIGNPCTHCLTAKLAGWTKTDPGTPWLPVIGTAVHTWLEEAFIRYQNQRNAQHREGLRYLTEHKVNVGTIGGTDIIGSCDLFDLCAGMVIDHKIVGKTTLRNAKAAGPNTTYRVQAHLYGRGWERAGHHVEHVAIAFLPRDHVSLTGAYLWTEPYDEQIAITALKRAERIHKTLTALEAISPTVRDTWITNQDRHHGCWDCNKYPDAPTGSTTGQGIFTDMPVG